jgi:GGDEF domain-containing protein
MFAGPPSARPARPVADDTVRRLAADGSELAKGWLVALVVDQPLELAPRLAGELAKAGAGRLCSAVVLALGSDGGLDALGPGGELESLAVDVALAAGGGCLEGALSALSALSRTIWAAVRRVLRDPDADLVADLAQRLARVEETLRAALLHAARTPPRPSAGADEQRHPGAVEDPGAGVAPVGCADQRRRANGPLWRAAIEEEVSRRDGGALALLLVSLQDAERVRQIEAEPDAGAVLARFTHALRASLRREDIVATERDGRAWVLAPGADRGCAIALAQRITRSVEAARPWRGAPMRAAVGIAILGEDGDDATQLCESAEESMLAAMAAGTAMTVEMAEPDGGAA